MTYRRIFATSRPLASALAITFCLMGSVSYSSSDALAVDGIQLANSETAQDAAAEQDSTETSLQAKYDAYINSVQTHLLTPLTEIAPNFDQARTKEFVEATDLDPVTVNAELVELLDELDKYEISGEDESVSEVIANLKTDANEIQETILQPLIPGQGTPDDIFIDLNVKRNAVLAGPQRAEVPLEENEKVIADIQQALGISLDPSGFQGFFGKTTYGAIDKFVNERNTRIGNSLTQLEGKLSLKNITPYGPFDGFPSVTTGAVLGLCSLGLIGLFLSKDKVKKYLPFAESDNQQEPSPQASPHESDELRAQILNLKQDNQYLREELGHLEDDYAALEEKCKKQQQQLVSFQHLLTKQQTNQPQPSTSPSAATKRKTTKRRASQAAAAQQAKVQKTTVRKRNNTEIGADNYNTNPNDFNKVATVALSQKSQEDLWAGKEVSPTFSPAPNGDYWVVTKDNRKFYLVVKRNAILNANNLKTLEIIYSYVKQPDIGTLKREYKNLARVEQHSGKDWMLTERGELLFQ